MEPDRMVLQMLKVLYGTRQNGSSDVEGSLWNQTETGSSDVEGSLWNQTERFFRC